MNDKLFNLMPKYLLSGGLLLAVWAGVSSIGPAFLLSLPLPAFGAQEPATTDAEEKSNPEKSKAEEKKPEVSAPQPVEVSPEAVAYLEQARKQLRSYRSVKADLTETALIGPRRFQAEGSYLQRGESEILFEFRLSVKGADGKSLNGSLLEVCDGQILWMSYKVAADLQVTRRDVAQIMEAAKESPSIEGELLASQLGLGGVSGLLASLQRSIAFDSISQETVDGNPYRMIAGGWSEEYLDKLKPPGATDDFVLPPYVPDRVRVFFDEQSNFPRRILYLKTIEGKSHPMLALDFFNVQTNIPVAGDAFQFTPPPDVLPQDITQDVIARIKAAASNTQPSAPNGKPQE